jgi:hypothetical protein
MLFFSACASADMSAESAKSKLLQKGIFPDIYKVNNIEHYVTLSGGQIQWIWHQLGISASTYDAVDYADNRYYIYNINDVKFVHNVQENGQPVLFSVIGGPLTKTSYGSVLLDGDLYNVYNWHAIMSTGYPWVEIIEYNIMNHELKYKRVGGPYDVTTIPSYTPKTT